MSDCGTGKGAQVGVQKLELGTAIVRTGFWNLEKRMRCQGFKDSSRFVQKGFGDMRLLLLNALSPKP